MMTDQINEERAQIDRIDREMAHLFEERMKSVRTIAECKGENGSAVRDVLREKALTEKNLSYIEDETIRTYYLSYFQELLRVSRRFQSDALGTKIDPSCLRMECAGNPYEIHIQKGLSEKAGDFFRLDRTCLILTDNGVPAAYVQRIAAQCKKAIVFTIPAGEGSKSLEQAKEIYGKLTAENVKRSDCILAVGGGVVGDLAGFVAATYLRGIDFYNIPTTLLAMVDSSIGGKVAVNFGSVKNQIGAFYQPRGVLIDPDFLATLPKEHLASGYAESIKMAVTNDEELFEILENGRPFDRMEEVIFKSLLIKKKVVEADEKESGYRMILNYGHTFGHAVESLTGMPHGLAVSVGMLPFASDSVKERLTKVLRLYGCPTECPTKADEMIDLIRHDKKNEENTLSVVVCPAVGKVKLQKMDETEWEQVLRNFAK